MQLQTVIPEAFLGLQHTPKCVSGRKNWLCWDVGMGVDHGGDRGHVPPEFGVGDDNANCPRRFCHISTRMSALWPSKYAKIRFRPGLRPGPRWGSSRRSPRSPSRLKRGHPSHTLPHSAPIHLRPLPCVPQNSSQIYAYGCRAC